VEYANVDITQREQVINTIEKIAPDYIIHLASMTDLTKDFPHALKSAEINIKGTLHILESIHITPVESFVILSTSDVYGGVNVPFRENQAVIPASPYSVSKASAELYALMFHRVYDLPVTILRSFNLFGKYQRPSRVIPYIILELINDNEVQLTSGKQKREFNYIDDLLDAIFLSLITPESQGKIINIGCGESIRIYDLALMIAQKFDKMDKLKFGAIPHRPNEIWDMYCNNTLAKSVLNWEPKITFEDGIDRTINWYKENFFPSDK
jgi:UDP-glucose 4-epimerase